MIELSSRQLAIVELVRKHEPITGDQIAEMLGLSRPTIRSDLSLLVMLRLLDAKPKVGYFLGPLDRMTPGQRSSSVPVGDVMSLPVIIDENATVRDAVVTLFMENTDSLIVCEEENQLVGIVSAKDMLKVTLGNAEAATMPISLVMTRYPNVITVQETEHVLDAARLMMRHDVCCLPVVAAADRDTGVPARTVIGIINTTIMTKLYVDD